MKTVDSVLQELKNGNRDFASGETFANSAASGAALPQRIQQKVIAAVLGCSDSRVPVEHIFSQGIGRLFVVRVAGNIAGKSQIASLEYAVESLGANLIIVLGHTHCGAVTDALTVRKNGVAASPTLESIRAKIEPAVDQAIQEHPEATDEQLIYAAVNHNVLHVKREITERSELIRSQIAAHKLAIVGARYCFGTGVVTFEEDLWT